MKIKSNGNTKEKHGSITFMNIYNKIFVSLRCLAATYLGSILILMLLLPQDTKFATSLIFIILFAILLYKPTQQSISYLENIIKRIKNLKKVNDEVLRHNRLEKIYYSVIDSIFVASLFCIHYAYLNTNIIKNTALPINLIVLLMIFTLLMNVLLFSLAEAYLIKRHLKIKFHEIIIPTFVSNTALYAQLMIFAFITFIFELILIIIFVAAGVGFG